MVKVSSSKKKHKYSLGAKGSPFYVRINTSKKSLNTGILLVLVDKVHGSRSRPGSAYGSLLKFLPGSRSGSAKTNVDTQHCFLVKKQNKTFFPPKNLEITLFSSVLP